MIVADICSALRIINKQFSTHQLHHTLGSQLVHRKSDYAGLETVSTHKPEIKILTLSSCFCKGHLVVSRALIVQVMVCTCYRESLRKSIGLQLSSSTLLHSFQKSGAEICCPDSSQVDTGSISEPAISAQCPCMHKRELLPAIFQNYLFYYFTNLYFNRSQNTASGH